MKRPLFLLFACFVLGTANGQTDKAMIEKACLDYIEGFYEGDTAKLIRALNPALYKFGYWRDKNSGKYAPDGQMTWRQALDYATRVAAKKNFAKAGSPKKVEVLDVMNAIAAAKVTAWWGVDYILLAKQNDAWRIDQVIWEGPLK